MRQFNFTNEDIENLLNIKKKSDERIKCLKDMIKHEEHAQLYLRPILRKYCKHEWNKDEEDKLRCSKCTLLKEIT
tara:strand:+ start:157 stop:381 length:225 start_codon:yes stop_codon:yes gene_type:complete